MKKDPDVLKCLYVLEILTYKDMSTCSEQGHRVCFEVDLYFFMSIS
jgi:hypothetical protein